MADEKKLDEREFAITIGDQNDRFSPGPSSSSSARPLLSPGAISGPRSSGIFAPANQGILSVLCYCVSSILMTTTNKYVLSGLDYNLNFLLLAVQSITCVVTIQIAKNSGWITFRDFNTDEARKCKYFHSRGK
jgi:GDP-mannose transporter